MSIKTAAATLTGLLVLAGSPAAAQTQAGIAMGATISAGPPPRPHPAVVIPPA